MTNQANQSQGRGAKHPHGTGKECKKLIVENEVNTHNKNESKVIEEYEKIIQSLKDEIFKSKD